MKNSIKALLIALSAALCLTFSACGDNGGTNGGGTSANTSSAAQENPADSSDTEATRQSGTAETVGDNSQQTEEETKPAEEPELWKNAKYTEDTEVGEGAVTVKVKVVAEDKSITLTVHTDRDMLGAALLDNELVSGEESEYGLYIKLVNGIEADYDKNQAYWAISKDGEYLMTGADTTPIADGENYELTYTKG